MAAAPVSGAEQAALDELSLLQPLPSERDAGWDEPPGAGAWLQADRLLELADRSGEHGWRRLAIAVFDYAADWDVHGVMQGIRHGPERAWSGDGDGMAAALEPLLRSPRPGTALWVARELGILRMLSSLPGLIAACRHCDDRVAEGARAGIGMLAQRHPEAGAALLEEQRRRGLPVHEVLVQTGAADPDWAQHGRTVTATLDGRWLSDTASLVTATLVLRDRSALGPDESCAGWLLPQQELSGRGLTLDTWQSLSVTATLV